MAGERKDAERRKLYEDLQMVCAGHTVEACIAALTDSLGSTIAFAADTIDQADKIVDLTGGDLKKAIRDNWDYLREVRAQSGLGPSAPMSN